ncbi:DNA-3-methyladenine glycosylase 2 family protein, partial [Acinetobacter baumannii]
TEPAIARAIGIAGYPETRIRDRGYATLLRTIVGQQVSVAAAASVWNKLEAALGTGCAPDALIAADFESLRACGLSRQKQGYARSLGELVVS